MIIENLDKLATYDERFARAVDYIKSCSPDTAPGRYDIDGDAMFALVQDYETLAEKPDKTEAHYRYIDVQTCLSGKEGVDCYNIEGLEEVSADKEQDIRFFKDSAFLGNRVELEPGRAAVFYPYDAHRPCLNPSLGVNRVRKIVVKILDK